MWTDISSLGAILSYGICLTLVLRSLFADATLNQQLIFGCAIIGIGFHAIALGHVILSSDGQNLSILVVASIVSWLIAYLTYYCYSKICYSSPYYPLFTVLQL